MPDSVGERLAALEAASREFKDAIIKSIDQRFDGLNKLIAGIDALLWRVIVGGIAAIVSLWIAFGTLYKEIRGVDTKMTEVESSLRSFQDATSKLSAAVEGFPRVIADIRNIASPVRSGGEQPGTLNILILDEKQRGVVRDTFPKVDGVIVEPLIDKLGIADIVTDPKTLSLFVPVPQSTLNDVPQLAGTKFALGKASVVIARVADNRIVAMVLR
jgi:hypothetical protein